MKIIVNKRWPALELESIENENIDEQHLRKHYM